MIDNKKITDKMVGLVGFRNSNDPSDPVLDYSLTKSASELYVDGAHELINTKNTCKLLVNYDNGVEDYDSLTTYIKDDQIVFEDKYFKAKEATTNTPPVTGYFWDGIAIAGDNIFYNSVSYNVLVDTTENPDESPSNFSEIVTPWVPIVSRGTLSDEIRTIIRSAGNDLLTDIISDKSIHRESKPLLESFTLYSVIGQDLEIKQDRRVGFEIEMVNSQGLIFLLNSIRTQFSELCTFDIQIHTPNSLEPVAIIAIDHTKKSSFQITKLAESLAFGVDSEIGDVMGSNVFYITYLEADLPLMAKAYTRPLVFNNIKSMRCGNCLSDIKLWTKATPFFSVTPFYVNGADLVDSTSLWDLDKNNYVTSTNFGLNFSNSVVCDETQTLLDNIDIFAPALQYQAAYKILEAFGASTRVSGLGDEIKSSLKAKAQFDTNSEKSPWLENYLNIRQGLRETFKNLSFPCFNPAERSGFVSRVL